MVLIKLILFREHVQWGDREIILDIVTNVENRELCDQIGMLFVEDATNGPWKGDYTIEDVPVASEAVLIALRDNNHRK